MEQRSVRRRGWSRLENQPHNDEELADLSKGPRTAEPQKNVQAIRDGAHQLKIPPQRPKGLTGTGQQSGHLPELVNQKHKGQQSRVEALSHLLTLGISFPFIIPFQI